MTAHETGGKLTGLTSPTFPSPSPPEAATIFAGKRRKLAGNFNDPRAICPKCGNRMSKQMTYVAPPAATSAGETILASEGGFVKGVVTYMIMDDLEVQPMSTISSIAMLNKLNVDLGALEERVVQLGLQEGLKLLKASLESNSVLTDVFLGMDMESAA